MPMNAFLKIISHLYNDTIVLNQSIKQARDDSLIKITNYTCRIPGFRTNTEAQNCITTCSKRSDTAFLLCWFFFPHTNGAHIQAHTYVQITNKSFESYIIIDQVRWTDSGFKLLLHAYNPNTQEDKFQGSLIYIAACFQNMKLTKINNKTQVCGNALFMKTKEKNIYTELCICLTQFKGLKKLLQKLRCKEK